MASIRLNTEYTYQSTFGPNTYYYTLVVDQAGDISVKNVISPNGPSVGALQYPQDVLDDIQASVTQLEDLFTVTTPINGTLTFTAETSQSVTFASALASSTYRVVLSLEDFVIGRIINKTTTGFTIELSSTYTGQVGYDVII